MSLPALPTISNGSVVQDLVANAAASATEKINTITSQISSLNDEIATKVAATNEAALKLEKLKASGASASEIEAASSALSAATAAADISRNAAAAATSALGAAEALKTAALARMNLAVIDDIEVPDFNLQLPTLTPASILGLLPPLPSLPEFPPKISVPLKSLLNPSMGFPEAGQIPAVPGLPALPTVPAVPGVVLSLLSIPPDIGNVGGPGGSFNSGANISTNVIATETVLAPDIIVGTSLTAPTMIAGNIASTTTLNLAATTAITLTSPIVTVTSAAVGVTGALTAASIASASKLFDIPHPTKPGMRLRHGCLEGPELAVYTRGKTKENIIPLPDYWAGLVDPNSITVQLTPTSSDQCLYVTKTSVTSIEVSGDLSLPYYFMIMAERIDVEKLQLEYEEPNGNI